MDFFFLSEHFAVTQTRPHVQQMQTLFRCGLNSSQFKRTKSKPLRLEIKTYPWNKSSYFKDDIKMIIVLTPSFSVHFS